MAEMIDVVTRLLKQIRLADKWHVLSPGRGNLSGTVIVRNDAEKLQGELRLFRREVDAPTELSDEEIKKRILDAIANATTDAYDANK
jgi:hypothetical protein